MIEYLTKEKYNHYKKNILILTLSLFMSEKLNNSTKQILIYEPLNLNKK